MIHKGISAIGLLVLFVLVLGCTSEVEIDGRTAGDWIGLLRHQDWEVQENASEALARLGPKAVPFLKQGLKAKDPTLRRGVIETLGKIGPPAWKTVPMLLSLISREEVAVIRAVILQSLARISPKDEKVQAEFNKRLRDVDAGVREEAQKGIDLLAPPEPETAPPPDSAVKPEVKPVALDEQEAKEPLPPAFVLREAVRAAVENKMPGAAFGMVAEVVRADRRAAIVWPAVWDGKILDGDIVAFVFERKGEEHWELVAETVKLNSKDAAFRLSEALGGADDQLVVRSCGVGRDRLQAHLSEHGKAFQEGLAGGKVKASMEAYEELTKAFSFSLAAYSDDIPEMLANKVLGSPWKINTTQDGNRLGVEIRAGDKTLNFELDLRPCGRGFVIGKVIDTK